MSSQQPRGSLHYNWAQFSSADAHEILGAHGAFLKKGVIQFLSSRPEKLNLQEEYASSFGDTTSADIVAQMKIAGDPVYFVIECKRTFNKAWAFLEAANPPFRRMRRYGITSFHGRYGRADNTNIVCSDAFELQFEERNGKPPVKADCSPIFQAATQLAQAYLGVMLQRVSVLRELPPRAPYNESFVPILVTNAPLYVQPVDSSSLDLSTGKPSNQLPWREVRWVVYQQPLALKPTVGKMDFRDLLPTHEDDSAHFPLRHQESLYIVNASSLGHLFDAAPWNC